MTDTTTPAAPESAAPVELDIQQILALLPHRYPFLLVDRVTAISGDDFCIGIKNITVNEPFFQGHFPGRPVFPGVLLIEGMAQSAGAMCAHFVGAAGKSSRVMFVTIDKAKFRRPVVPGDVVEFHMQKRTRKRAMWWYNGVAKVRGEIVAEAEVGAMIGVEG